MAILVSNILNLVQRKCFHSLVHSISDSVYGTLIAAVRKLEPELEFTRNDKFGWLTMDPSTVGTTLNCHVRMKLKMPLDYLKEIGEQFHLIVAGVTGVACAEHECIIDISNKRVFGLSEFDCMKTVYYGVKEIVRRNLSERRTNVGSEEEEVAATTCDEPQAEISLNSVQSNGTYTKEQVEYESASAPDEPAVVMENTEIPTQSDDAEECEQSLEPEEPTAPDNVEVADENIESNEEAPAAEN